MGIENLVNKAKDALKGHEDQVAGALDKAGDAVKSRTDDATDARIDGAVDKARKYLEDQK